MATGTQINSDPMSYGSQVINDKANLHNNFLQLKKKYEENNKNQGKGGRLRQGVLKMVSLAQQYCQNRYKQVQKCAK